MFPHGALEQLDEHLFCVKGEIKLKALGRRMVVVRDLEGGLFIHNAIMLEDFAPLDALGEVRAIFVPNRFHDMDAGGMKERYPRARLAALPAAKKKLEKKFPALEALEAPPSSAAITPLAG